MTDFSHVAFLPWNIHFPQWWKFSKWWNYMTVWLLWLCFAVLILAHYIPYSKECAESRTWLLSSDLIKPDRPACLRDKKRYHTCTHTHTIRGRIDVLKIVMILEITLTLQPSQVVISPNTMASSEGVMNLQTFEISNKVDVWCKLLSLFSMLQWKLSLTDNQYRYNTKW